MRCSLGLAALVLLVASGGAADEPAKGSVKVPGVSLEKGELTVEIDWGKAPPTLEAKDVTLEILDYQFLPEPLWASYGRQQFDAAIVYPL